MTSAILTHHEPSTCTSCVAMRGENERLSAELSRLEWDETIGMFNQAGGYRAIDALPSSGVYTLVFCDIDYLKQINSATQNHLQTNRYLAAGLKVRRGEIAIRYLGDEFLFVLNQARRATDPARFAARLARQLAAQPLTDQQRGKLPSGRLSATFAWRAGVAKSNIRATIELLSIDVLTQKDARPC